MINDNAYLEEIEKALDELSLYYFELGILDENADKEVKVKIVDIDNKEKEISMKIGDIMYFVENGTVTLPSRHIFDKANNTLEDIFEQGMSEITNDILDEKYNFQDKLQSLQFRLQDTLKLFFKNEMANVNKVGSIINEDDNQNKYIYNLTTLSQYITCKIKKI